jgi:hypothetical protein
MFEGSPFFIFATKQNQDPHVVETGAHGERIACACEIIEKASWLTEMTQTALCRTGKNPMRQKKLGHWLAWASFSNFPIRLTKGGLYIPKTLWYSFPVLELSGLLS